MTISQILIVAFIGEAVWETCKMFYQKGKVSTDRIGAAVIGLLLAFGAKLDFLALVGIPLVIPYLGYIVTGLLISRGANVVHDIWNVIGSFTTRVKTTTDTAVKKAGDKVIIPKSMEDGKYKVDVEPISSVDSVNSIGSVNPAESNSNLAKASDKLKNLGARASRIIEIIKRTPKEPELKETEVKEPEVKETKPEEPEINEDELKEALDDSPAKSVKFASEEITDNTNGTIINQ